jgi:hypothetical protein
MGGSAIEVKLYLHSTSALEGGGWSAPCAPAALPRERDPVQEDCWALGLVGIVSENLVPQLGSNPGPSSPIASRYTDCLHRPVRK